MRLIHLLRRRRPILAAAAVALAVAALAPAASAAPGDPVFAVHLTDVDGAPNAGTGAYDATDGAGYDSGGSNDIVRTNDTIAYRVEVAISGGDATGARIRIVLPKGQQLTALPPYCIAGSTATPTLPAPALPITSTSWTSLPIQTVDCLLDPSDTTNNTTFSYDFTAKVRPEMPNGTLMSPVSAAVSSIEAPAPATSNTVQQTVSASAKADLSKNSYAGSANTGTTYQTTSQCAWDTSRTCILLEFPISLSVPQGGVGSTPLVSPLTFTDDVTPSSFFTSPAVAAAVAADPDRYGVRLSGCNYDPGMLGPFPRLGYSSASTTVNSVRNSGTAACSQPGGPGSPISISYTGADTSAYTRPSTAGSNASVAIPADRAALISGTLILHMPAEVVTELGTASGGRSTVGWRNTFADFHPTGIDGSANLPGADAAWNDWRSGTSSLASTGSAGKTYAGVPGATGNSPASTYSGNAYEGPPGASTSNSGDGIVLAGQRILSMITTSNQIPPNLSGLNRAQVLCDSWDPTKLSLAAGSYPAGSGSQQRYPSNGSAAWVSSYFANGSYQPSASAVPGLSFQYGSGAWGAGAASECADASSPSGWYASPADVPGNDPAQAALGVYTAANKVRIFYIASAGSDPTVNLSISIGLLVRPDAGPVGTILPNFMGYKVVNGATSQAGVLSGSGSWNRSSYVPAANSGSQGSRVAIGTVIARITKVVETSPGSESFGATTPVYTGGNTVRYKLRPSLTSPVPTSQTADMQIEDCLAAGTSYVVDSAVFGADPAPRNPQVDVMGAPSGAGIACAADRQYLRWDLPAVQIGAPIPEITYTVEVQTTANDGVVPNTALVSAVGDISTVAQRTASAQIQIQSPSGIKLSKTTPTPTVEVNRADATSLRHLRWAVTMRNFNSPSTITDAELIDILPADGLTPVAGQPATELTGSLALVSATVTGPGATTAQVLYTRAPAAAIAIDPKDPSNARATTSIVWCSAPAGGTVVFPTAGSPSASACPSSAAEVTALRVFRPGAFTPAQTFALNVDMLPTGNMAGDVYRNYATAAATGLTNSVGPIRRDIAVVSSSIGDLVWLDRDADGIQDADEPPVAGFQVRLEGSDSLGNPVSLSTTTAVDGTYSFANLASGQYRVVFDPAGLAAGQSFTALRAGSDTAVDSNGDPITGITAAFALAAGTADSTVDQGIVPAFTDVQLAKSVIDPTPAAVRAASFPVQLTCLAPGAPAPVVRTVSILADGSPSTVEDVESGSSCTLAELDSDGAAASVQVDPATAAVAADGSFVLRTGSIASAVIVNTYSPALTSVDLSKSVVDPTPAASGRATQFPVELSCVKPGASLPDVTTVVLGIDGSVETVDGIWLGSTCTVAEPDANGAAVSISPSGQFAAGSAPVSAVVTNTYEPALTALRVTKTVIDPTPSASGRVTQFPVTVSCVRPGQGGPDVRDIVVSAGAPVLVDGLWVGSVCQVSETFSGGATPVVSPAGEFAVADGQVAEVSIVNTFDAVLTAVNVRKVVVDPTPSADGRADAFPVDLSCLSPGAAEPQVTELMLDRNGAAVTVDGILVGSVCSVVETDSDGAASTVSPGGEFVVDGNGASVTVTNVYEPALAAVSIAKAVIDPTPSAAGRAGSFPVTLECVRPGETEAAATELMLAKDGSPVAVEGLYVGSMCTVTETDSNGAVASVSPAGQFQVGSGGVSVTVTNTYEAVVSGALLRKVVVDPTPLAQGRASEFPVQLSCVRPGADAADSLTVHLPIDGSAIPVGGLLVGSVCTVTELDANGAASSIDVGEFVVAEGRTESITVTNTYDPAVVSVTLRKVVVDPTPQPGRAASFPVELSCVRPGSDEAAVTRVDLLADGTPSVVEGIWVDSVCSATETGSDGAVSSVDPSGSFEAGPSGASVTVTNTYAAVPTVDPQDPADPSEPGSPSDPGGPSGGSVPEAGSQGGMASIDTGEGAGAGSGRGAPALVAGGLLVAAAGALALAARRRGLVG